MQLRRIALSVALLVTTLPASSFAVEQPVIHPMNYTEIGPWSAERNRVLTIHKSCIDTSATESVSSIQRFYLWDLQKRPLVGRTITLGELGEGKTTLTVSPTSGVTNDEGFVEFVFTAGPGTEYEERRFTVTYDGIVANNGVLHMNISLKRPLTYCPRAAWEPATTPSGSGSLEITSPKRGENHETNAASVELGGTFGDGVTGVMVNGVAATLNGSSHKWHLKLALEQGENVFVARGLAADGTEMASDTIKITRSKEKKDSDEDTPSERFDDVPTNHSGKNAIEKLYEKGVIRGRGNGKFVPEGAVTRAEFMKMLAGTLGVTPESGDAGFTDVSSTHTLAGFIAVGKAKGWAKGQQGRFKPDAPITRMEAARMIVRAKGLTGSKETKFSDVLSAEEQEVVGAIVANGIAKGSGEKFHPSRFLTRAEAAIMLSALL